MQSYTGIISRSLKAHAQRSLLTIASIALAVAFIAAVSILAVSIRETQIRRAIDLTGNFHGTFKDLTAGQMEDLRVHPDFEAVGLSAPLGAQVTHSLTITIEGFDPTAIEMFHLGLMEGRFPSGLNEIALEEWMLAKLDPALELGETFSLPYQTTWTDAAGERHATQAEADFVLVGVLENIAAAQVTGTGIGLTTPETVAALLPPEQLRFTSFVRFEDPKDAEPHLERIAREIGVDKARVSGNRYLLTALDSNAEANLPLLLLAGLVLAAAGMAIANIFHISIVERLRQFGILRAQGATAAQIAWLVLGEALLLCALAIPLGLLVGTGFAWLLSTTLKILHSQIGALLVPPLGLLAAAGAGLAATLVSALFPALVAARVPPLVAIRGPNAVLAAPAARPNSWQRRFDIPARLAYLNLWRNPRRAGLTVFSLGLGVTLFIAFSTYADGMDPASMAETYINGDYAVYTNNILPDSGYSPEVAAQIEALPGVEQVVKTRVGGIGFALLPADRVNPDLAERMHGPMNPGGDVQETFGEPGFTAVPYQLYGVDSKDLARLDGLVTTGALDPRAMAEQPLALLVDPEGTSGLHVGDTLTLKRSEIGKVPLEIHEITFTISAVLSDPPVYLGYGSLGPQLVAHSRYFEEFYGTSVYKRFDITLADPDQAALVETRLEQLAAQAEGGVLMTYQAMLAQFAQEKREMTLLIYSLVGIVTLIGVANLINTLTTSLILRTRELGMLRAVGMTPAQLGQMTRLEGLFYGLFSSTWGALAGSGLAYVLVRAMQAQGSPVEWSLPWLPVCLAVLASLGLGALVTLRPSRRVARMAVVEALRAIE